MFAMSECNEPELTPGISIPVIKEIKAYLDAELEVKATGGTHEN